MGGGWGLVVPRFGGEWAAVRFDAGGCDGDGVWGRGVRGFGGADVDVDVLVVLCCVGLYTAFISYSTHHHHHRITSLSSRPHLTAKPKACDAHPPSSHRTPIHPPIPPSPPAHHHPCPCALHLPPCSPPTPHKHSTTHNHKQRTHATPLYIQRDSLPCPAREIEYTASLTRKAEQRKLHQCSVARLRPFCCHLISSRV